MKMVTSVSTNRVKKKMPGRGSRGEHVMGIKKPVF